MVGPVTLVDILVAAAPTRSLSVRTSCNRGTTDARIEIKSVGLALLEFPFVVPRSLLDEIGCDGSCRKPIGLVVKVAVSIRRKTSY